MNEVLVPFTICVEAQVTADGVIQWSQTKQMTIVGASLCAEAFTGTPTGFNVDIQDDTVDCITAIAANTAKTAGTWLSKHWGGSNDPVHVAAGSVVEVDVNLVGGTSPTADFTLVIWALIGE